MNTQTKIGIGLAVLLVGLGAVRFGLFSKGPDDQTLIRQAMDDAIVAAQEGRSGPVLDFISDQISVNGSTQFSKKQIAQYVRANKPEVKVADDTATVSGDSATVVTSVHVRVPAFGGMPFDGEFKDVTMLFAREDTVKWLIFPAKTWRLRKVSSPNVPSLDATN